MLNRRLTRAAAAVAAASVLSVWSPQIGYELGLSSSNRAQAATYVTPANFRVDSSNTRLFAYWTPNSDNATGYRVTWTPVFTSNSTSTTVAATANSVSITGLSNSTNYTVTVVALYADGGTSTTASTTAQPTTNGVPLPVTGLSAVPALQDSKVTLNWTLPTDGNRQRVDVYRDGALRATLGTNATSFSEAGLTNYTAYKYDVYVVNTTTFLGLTNYERSDLATVNVTPVDLTPPAAPLGVTAVPTDKAVGLSWNANGETDFDHYTVTGPAGNVDTTVPAYTASGLTNGTTYTFTVYAVDKRGNKSVGTTVTSKPVDNVAPDVPTNLAVTPADSSLDASWTRSAALDTAAYNVHVNGAYKMTVPVGTVSAHITGLTNGTSYKVQVLAVDGNSNESALSSAAYGTPADRTPPSAPTAFLGTAGDGFAKFTWNASPENDVDKYLVRNAAGTTVATVGKAVTTATVTGLTNGVAATFTVVAVDVAGNVSAASNTASVTPRDTTPPAAPSNLSGVAGDTKATLSWTASPDSDVANYLVRNASGTVLATVPVGTTTAVLTGLANDASITLTVVAVDATGNVSAASNAVTVTPRDTTPPAAPLNLAGTAGDTQVTLTWSASPESDLDRYVVRNSSGTTVATVPGGTTKAVITGLTNDSTVTYTVVAVDRSNNVSAASNSVSVTPRDTTPPSSPTNLVGVAGDTTATLTWTLSPESDVDHYVVRNAAGVTAASVGSAVNTTKLTGLANDVAVSYSVVAVDRSGNTSAASAVVTVTPRDTTAPSAPTGLTGTAGDSTAALSWTASPESDVAKYVVTNAAGTVIATITAPATTANLAGLTNDTALTLKVSAVDSSGNVSAASNTVTLTPRDTTAPSAPTTLRAVAGDAQATLTWTGSPEADVDHYLVRAADGSTAATTGATTTNAVITNLTNGTTASFTVVAVDRSGNVSAATSSVSVTPRDTTAPSAPTNVSGTAGDGQATVTWTRSPESDVAQYVVRNAAGTTVATVPAAGSSATITGLTNGTAATFTVRAVDATGNVSVASSPVTLTPLDTTPPPAPAGVGSSAGASQVTVTWAPSANPDIDHYEVVDQGGTLRASAPAGSTSTTVTGLTNGTAYTFSVVAVDAAGNRSGAVGAPAATPRAPLATPAGVVAAAGDTQVSVTWQTVSDVRLDHYLVCTAGGSCSSVPAGTTGFVATSLTNGTSYSFTVASVDAAGNVSAPSSSVSATPRSTPLAAPQNLTGNASDAAAALTWSTVSGASSYDILQNGVVVQNVLNSTANVIGLTNGTAYQFSVRALGAAGNVGTTSAAITVTPQATPPAVVQDLAGTAGDATAGLTWTAVSGATAYDVLQNGVAVQRVTTNSATVAGLTNGTVYQFSVRAVSSSGAVGAASSVISLTPTSTTSTTTPTVGAGATSGTVQSRDGRISVFGTAAQLEVGDTNTTYELYVKDWSTGNVSRVDPTLASSDLGKSQLALSNDGRYLAVTTSASKSAADTNSLTDVYRVDLSSRTWTLVSAPTGGGASTNTAGSTVQTGIRTYATSPSVAISGDGSKVFFFSERSDLVAGDTNNATDLFMKDVSTGAVTRVSTSATGGQLSGGVQGPALSVTPDGRYVVFVAKPSNALVAWRKDLQTGALDVVSGVGSWSNLQTAYLTGYDAHEVSISDDGRYVAFTSNNSTLATNPGDYLAYRRDMTVLTSKGIVRAGLPNQTSTWEHQVALDPTGQFVFFQTQANYGADTDGHTDWYRRDVTGGTVVQVTSTSNGAPASVKQTGSVSAAEYGAITVLSADQVIVATMQALVAGDTNKVMDVYRKTISTGSVSSAV